MDKLKDKKIIIAGVVIAVVILAIIISYAVSCNSGSDDEGASVHSSENAVYESTEEISSKDIAASAEETVAIGDNEVPFDDIAAEAMSSFENVQETIVYEVTKADGSKVTEADGSVVTTVAYVIDEGINDNEVPFVDETTADTEPDTYEEYSTEVADTLPDNIPEVETDKDGWTTNIVKP